VRTTSICTLLLVVDLVDAGVSRNAGSMMTEVSSERWCHTEPNGTGNVLNGQE
jgi:hypothetical protein